MSLTDVVLIEDNRHDIEMIFDALREHNLNCSTVALTDGAKGLEYFFGADGCVHIKGSRLPRLVLLDLKLPKVNGLEVLKGLKGDERTRHVPVVVFTSSNEYCDKQESYALCVNSYLVKPLDAEKFSRFVAKTVKYWLTINTTSYFDPLESE